MRSAEIEKAAELARDNGGFQSEGKINAYRCLGSSVMFPKGKSGGCGYRMVTIDRETGVTPFLTQCPNCQGEAQSSMYRVPAGLQPTHEWYRPDSLEGLPPHSRDHVLKGGLLLREIEQPAEQEPSKESAHRMPDWRRFTGDLSVVAMVDGNTPTVGVASDICDECGTRRVLIACISEAGHECNIGLDPDVAIEIARAIQAAALRVIEAKGQS